MKTINELLTYIIDKHKNGTDAKVLGEGSYSVVWDFGTDAYKLSNELNYNGALQMQEKNNLLYKNGVNVPLIKEVDKFNLSNNSLVSNIKSFLTHYKGEKFFEMLEGYAQGCKGNQGEYAFIGIRQQKICGINCFSQLPTDAIMLADKISDRVNTLPTYVLTKLEEQLENNLDFFMNINPEHFTKFITDGNQILRGGLSIDNQLKTNFLYTPNGFYYIDLDGIGSTRVLSPISNVFDATVDNICSMVHTKANGYSQAIAKQQLELCLKLVDSALTSCSNEDIKNMFWEYSSRENYLKQLFNNALNNVDNKTATNYKNKLKNLYKQNQQVNQPVE